MGCAVPPVMGVPPSVFPVARVDLIIHLLFVLLGNHSVLLSRVPHGIQRKGGVEP